MSLYSEQQLDKAYIWLCKQRRNYPLDADIWHLRIHWSQEKRVLLKELEGRQYRFSPMQAIKTKSGKTIHLWSSRDALVLKMVSLWLPGKIPLSTHCTHLKDHGGLYRDITRGISRGCPLSPLIDAFYLKIVDDRLSCSGLYYVRYMDDVLILASTRWKLRRAVKTLNTCFAALKLEQHPDKTFIGRIEKGFGFDACEPDHPAFQGASSPALRATAGSPAKGCAAG